MFVSIVYLLFHVDLFTIYNTLICNNKNLHIFKLVNTRPTCFCDNLHRVWWLVCLYFSYIVVVSFIGGGNLGTQTKPPTCRKSLTNFITYCCIEYTLPWTDFELKTLVVICIDYITSLVYNCYYCFNEWYLQSN